MELSAAALVLLANTCAPAIDPATTQAVVAVESSYNPFAIGVVGGALKRQPTSRAEALATIAMLDRDGWDYSVGLGQINKRNFTRLGINASSALEPCTNLHALQTILSECFLRAEQKHPSSQAALRAALSCYYSGNFATGFRHGYVARVVAAAARQRQQRANTKEVPNRS